MARYSVFIFVVIISLQDVSCVHLREERGVGEGSGLGYLDTFNDYGIDDEDHEFGSTTIVSSRIVPVASSPIFNIGSVSAATRGYTPSTLTSQTRRIKSKPSRPARPTRLTSYYPSLRQEGSGVGPPDGGGPEYNDSDLIAPTRTVGYNGPLTSISPPLPGYNNGGISSYATLPTNHEPIITSRLDKVPLNAGKNSRIVIPANTFQDLEDGDTRDLHLNVLDKETGLPINDLAWAKFKEDTQEIFFLPLEENIGHYNFLVKATDSGGESQQDTLVVAVRQFAISRTFHHEFQASLSLMNRRSFSHPMDWKLFLLESLVKFFGDPDPGKLTTLEIDEAKDRPGKITFRWTNDSLPRQSCPRNDIKSLFARLVDNSGRPSIEFKRAVQLNFQVESVSLEWKGLCHKSRSGEAEDKMSVTTGAGTQPGEGYDNSMPQIRNPVDKLNITAGELLQYQVPGDMCWDKESGGTRDLNLQLLTLSRLEVASDSWLQFDTRNQEFLGVPLEGDVGREEFQLVCSDTEGYSAIDGIEVTTLSRPFYERFNLQLVFVFNDTLDDGVRLGRSRAKLMKKIAKIFRDPDTSQIVLNRVDPISFEVAWYNKTLSTRVARDCPLEQIMWMRHLLLSPETGVVRQRVVQAFSPAFHLAEVKLLMLESCLEVEPPSSPDPPGDPIHDLLPPGEYVLAFVVPALIIVCMLLLAVLIACILHRKRMAGKLDMFKTEALPPRIPVIMQDELCEDNFNLSKQPIILREEPLDQRQPSQTSYNGLPPRYLTSSRHEDDFSECESLVNGASHNLQDHQMQGTTTLQHNGTYSRPPPVSMEFSDPGSTLRSGSRHRPAPQYRQTRQQNFEP